MKNQTALHHNHFIEHSIPDLVLAVVNSLWCVSAYIGSRVHRVGVSTDQLSRSRCLSRLPPDCTLLAVLSRHHPANTVSRMQTQQFPPFPLRKSSKQSLGICSVCRAGVVHASGNDVPGLSRSLVTPPKTSPKLQESGQFSESRLYRQDLLETGAHRFSAECWRAAQ